MIEVEPWTFCSQNIILHKVVLFLTKWPKEIRVVRTVRSGSLLYPIFPKVALVLLLLKHGIY